MKLTSPVQNMRWAKYPVGDVTQWIGENVPLYKSLGIGLEKGHNGIDIVRPHGEHMFAVEKGIVKEVKLDANGYGKHVRIRSVDGKRQWTYGHCDRIFVVLGQEVQEGQFIATMGNTGFVVSGNTPYWGYNPYAGTHLHFGLRLYNKYGQVINYDNGSLGAIDPLPYFLPPALLSTKIIKISSVTEDKVMYQFGELLQKIGM